MIQFGVKVHFPSRKKTPEQGQKTWVRGMILSQTGCGVQANCLIMKM